MGTVDQMLEVHRASKWKDVPNVVDRVFDDETRSAYTRLVSYVDYCFEEHDVLDPIPRERVHVFTANWDARRGICRYNQIPEKNNYGKRLPSSQFRPVSKPNNVYAIGLSRPLIGVPPEDDRGTGWKATVHHELAHAVDYEDRGTSDHSKQFKRVVRMFGHDNDNGHACTGLKPKYHR